MEIASTHLCCNDSMPNMRSPKSPSPMSTKNSTIGVARVWSSPGVSTERQSLFLAPYCPADRSGKGGGAQGEHDGITVVERTLDGLAFDADQGRIADAKLLNLVLAYALGARNSLRRSIAPTHGEPIAPVANVDLFRSISPIAQFLL